MDGTPPGSVEPQDAGVHPALMSFLHGAPTAGPESANVSPTRAADTRPLEADGIMGLTPREHQVLGAIAQGASNRQIANRLDMKEGTVKTHLYSLFRKLAVPNRAAAALCGARLLDLQQQELDSAANGSLDLRRLRLEMSQRRVRAGEWLFHTGEVGSELFYVQRGRVSLPEIGLTVGPTGVFGEIGIFTPERRQTCSAQCETEVDVLSLTSAQARRIYLTNPQFALFILTLVTTRLMADSRRHTEHETRGTGHRRRGASHSWPRPSL